MIYRSILFEKNEATLENIHLEEPPFFADLNLDQVLEAITAGKQDYNLKSFFYTPLHDPGAIQYRQKIMCDLENEILLEYIETFAHEMSRMRRYLTLIQNLYDHYHEAGWMVEAIEVYCEAVQQLACDLNAASLSARGLLAFRDYLARYVQSDAFATLTTETKELKAALGTVKYCVIIRGGNVRVQKYDDEVDYSIEVEATFEKFKQGAVKTYLVKLPEGAGMNHVEARILTLVARLYPDIFATLDQYCVKNSHFQDQTIRAFDREIQFYVAYLEYLKKFKRAGLKFCYPQISARSKEVRNKDGFDLALAEKLIGNHAPMVCNDFYLTGPERIFIVSGPNQGGKTTFARTFGQLHYLASLGCPVPGREAKLFLYDQLFTHFEQEEDIQNLRGKLQDDLVRIHHILEQATPNSLIIMNEIFTSTTLQDAVFLSKKVIEKIIELDALGVCVTFIDELASLSPQTVSMVSTVVPENPAERTFKILRKPADGLAYALSIAEKYRLTYAALKERIPA